MKTAHPASFPPGVCGSGGMMRSASASIARPSAPVKNSPWARLHGYGRISGVGCPGKTINDDGGAGRQTAKQPKRGARQQISPTDAHDEHRCIRLPEVSSFPKFSTCNSATALRDLTMSIRHPHPCQFCCKAGDVLRATKSWTLPSCPFVSVVRFVPQLWTGGLQRTFSILRFLDACSCSAPPVAPERQSVRAR